MARPVDTRTITDQLINRRYKEQLVPGPDFEIDNYMDSINSELTQPLRIKADVNGSYLVQVQSIDIQNPETLVHRVRHPIKKKVPTFTGATITFPNTSGNPIVVSVGTAEQLNIPNDEYAKVLVQIDDTGGLRVVQGFPAATPELAELPKPKSGLHSLGYILLHMGSGGVLDLVGEEDVWQFWGPEDNQDYIESLRLLETRSDYKRVTLTKSDYDGSDDNIWGQTIDGKRLIFTGRQINFETGDIYDAAGVAVVGTFTPASVPSTFWQWYSVSIVPTTEDANGNMQAIVEVVAADLPGTTINNAPRAPWTHHERGIRIGQVAVQGGAVPGEIENIFDANIFMKAELSSEGEGRQFGVDDVPALKALLPYERHHHMLRLVESDLQGRGVLYRWDEFNSSADTTGLVEIGEAPKVVRPDDLTAPEAGRWLTITAMDIGQSVVRTDMIRDDNITLAKLIHSDPHRVVGYNASGVPTDLFELDLTDGLQTAPTYSFALDQDTGWFRTGDGQGAYASNGVRKWYHSWDATNDYHNAEDNSSTKNVHIRSLADGAHVAYVEAMGNGIGGDGAGVIYAGQDVSNGGGFMYDGDDSPNLVGRSDAISFFRRTGGVDSEVFWYRPNVSLVHYETGIAIKDNDGATPNPEPGYLALYQDNDSLYMQTSAGTIINIPNQSEADARYLRRNASDTPSADNTWNLGTAVLRWANIYAVTFRGNATSANYADLAERYEADMELEPGDVVKLGGAKEITKTVYEYDMEVFGVVSTNPAFRMNDKEGDCDKTKPFVAFAGRLPCKVKGPVKKGERLCSADEPGVARALPVEFSNNYHTIIGRALEDKTTDEVELVEIVVGAK